MSFDISAQSKPQVDTEELVGYSKAAQQLTSNEGTETDVSFEDWTKMSDFAERIRIQNRIAQRIYRKKLTRRLEDLDKKVTSLPPEQSDLAPPPAKGIKTTRKSSSDAYPPIRQSVPGTSLFDDTSNFSPFSYTLPQHYGEDEELSSDRSKEHDANYPLDSELFRNRDDTLFQETRSPSLGIKPYQRGGIFDESQIPKERRPYSLALEQYAKNESERERIKSIDRFLLSEYSCPWYCDCRHHELHNTTLDSSCTNCNKPRDFRSSTLDPEGPAGRPSHSILFPKIWTTGEAAISEFTSDFLHFEEIKEVLTKIKQRGQLSAKSFEIVFRTLLYDNYFLSLMKASQGTKNEATVFLVSDHSRLIRRKVMQEVFDGRSTQSPDGILEPRQQIHQNDSSSPTSIATIVDDDAEEQRMEKGVSSDYSSARRFFFEHQAFTEFRARLWYLADPTMESRMKSLSSQTSGTRAHFSSSRDGTDLISRYKKKVEDFTGTCWDWWPMEQSRPPIRPGFQRLIWQCECGDGRFEDVPNCFAEKYFEDTAGLQPLALPGDVHQATQAGAKMDRSWDSESGNDQSARFQGLSSTQDIGYTRFSGNVGSNKTEPGHRSNPVGPNDLNLHVFLGIPLGDDIRLEHIHVTDFQDDKFFKEIRNAYNKIRGVMRCYFSIRKYAHCDFYKFEKFDAGEYVALERNSVPSEYDSHYQYNPKPVQKMPPISRHEFKKRFYWCYGRCLLGLLGLHNPLHKCKKRCRTSPDAVNLVPKRSSPLETGGDGREEFWGLYVGEVISAVTVVVYLVLILIAPFLFFLLWLFCWGHPGDLQNASVPLLSTLGLLGVSGCGFFGGSLYNENASIM